MKKEQSATVLYTILGCVVGYISLSVDSFILILVLVLAIYFATVLPVSKKVNIDKVTKWLFSNTFVTYFLVWLIVYILLSNVI
jgi:tetrahydromethanopterin S-methyltransferase subunit D